MGWTYLFIAGILEIAWAIGLKYSEGFTKLWPSVWTLTTMTLGIVFLSLALRTLPLGTAYAIWTGIGTLGVVIWGIFVFGEPVDAARLCFIAMIVAGIVGLKMTSPH